MNPRLPVYTNRLTALALLCAGALVAAPRGLADTDLPRPATPRFTRASAVSNVTFVVFDLETTGFSPTTDRVVELGAVKFRNGQIIDQKSWLINPERNIPIWNQKVHGISNEDVKDAPTFRDVYPEFEKFIEGCVLIAHNARFDISFLNAETRRAGLHAPRNKVIDSLPLFRRWFPNCPSYSLENLARTTGVPVGVLHRAAACSTYVFLIFDKGLKARDGRLKLRDIYDASGGVLQF